MPVAVRIRLSTSEKRALLAQRHRAKSRRVVDRITAILMVAAGMAIGDIVHALGITRRTLTNWRQRWLRRKHFGFEDAPRSGRPPEVTARYVRELVRVVQRDPRECGYAFTRWTAPRLAEYLFQLTGVRVGAEWVSDLLRMHGFVWRKTKRTIRNLQNRAATKRARKALRRLKKGLSIRTRTTSCGLPTVYASSSCP